MIFDNHKKNRIILFSSSAGLKMLAESRAHYADGTFRCAAKYFAQLYVIMAFFESNTENKGKDKVWQKRMIPAAWAFSKRRRTKDYVTIFSALKKEAFKLGFVLDPTHVFTDFELAAMRAFRACLIFLSLLN
jgi:hypothetical protein